MQASAGRILRVIELTGRTYAAPWTDEDAAIFYRCMLTPAIRLLDGDKADAEIMLGLACEPTAAAAPGTPHP